MKLLKAFFGFGMAVGFFTIACVASTIDHPGSIPVTDGQLLLLGLIGSAIFVIGALGLKSVEEKNGRNQ